MQLSERELDALREVANIGSGHAATVLSQMTDKRIMIDVPQITMEPLDEVAQGFARPEDRVVALSMRMLGDLTGHTLFLLRQENAAVLANLLLHRDADAPHEFAEMEQSSLKEAGNIMAGSFMNALATCFGKAILPSVPHVTIDRSDALRPSSDFGGGMESVLVVETNFRLDEPELVQHKLRGVFLFVLDRPSLNALFEMMGQ